MSISSNFLSHSASRNLRKELRITEILSYSQLPTKMCQVDVFLFIYLMYIILVLAGQELKTSRGFRIDPTDVNTQITSRFYTVFSPDDGHIVARNI
jgi:hypothetical protein